RGFRGCDRAAGDGDDDRASGFRGVGPAVRNVVAARILGRSSGRTTDMIVAITRASGFIGSYTVAALHKAGHEVCALVRPTSRRDHIEKFVAQCVEGDAADPQAIAGLVAGAEVVIHDAADWDALRRSPVSNYERNVMGSLRLLEAARQAGVGQFIFVSSVA